MYCNVMSNSNNFENLEKDVIIRKRGGGILLTFWTFFLLFWGCGVGGPELRLGDFLSLFGVSGFSALQMAGEISMLFVLPAS